ncbi:MAG: hypothetical protein GEU28_06150 [Dehalococcoidia bacterium]|nr:hypothetical protein [Dehalococcoidia bacterium]
MSKQARALVVGMIGPTLAAAGLIWGAVDALVDPREMTFRRFVFDPAVLLVLVGVAVPVFCLPLVIRIMRASEDELLIPILEPEREGVPSGAEDLAGRAWEPTD